MRRSKLSREKGNAFFFVLLGIVLFAALAITFTRGMRGNTTARLTSKEVDIAVSEVMEYMQRVERAVNRVRRNNCSENDISFENAVVSGYEHTPAAAEKCRVFSPSGGNMNWKNASLGNTPYQFWGSDAVQGIGTSKSDLIMAISLQPKYRAVCQAYNLKLHNTNVIVTGSGDEDGGKFTGLFGDSYVSITETPGKISACFDSDGGESYIIYHVLLAR